MNNENFQKMVLDVIKIIVFGFSWVYFTIPFFPSKGSLSLGMPEHGAALLFCFTSSAMCETLSGIGDDVEIKLVRGLNIIEISVGILIIIFGTLFYNLEYFFVISVMAIICSLLYFFIKAIRLGRVFKAYYLGKSKKGE